jgi:hypothetical protein
MCHPGSVDVEKVVSRCVIILHSNYLIFLFKIWFHVFFVLCILWLIIHSAPGKFSISIHSFI